MIDIAFWAPRWATTGNPAGPARASIAGTSTRAPSPQFTAAVVKRYSGNFVPEADTEPTPAG